MLRRLRVRNGDCVDRPAVGGAIVVGGNRARLHGNLRQTAVLDAELETPRSVVRGRDGRRRCRA